VIGEPAIKLRLATSKGPAVVLALERLRARVGHRAALLEDAWPREEFLEVGGNAGRTVENLRQAVPLLVIQREDGSIGHGPLGLHHRRRADELAELAV
jgi:hypothetical protein